MATSEERDGRKRRLSEKGLNRMVHITSERAQSTSSSSLPGHDHDHQPPQSLLDQTKDEKKESFGAASERASDERRKTAERGLNRMSRAVNQSNLPKLDHHQAPQTYPSDQIHGRNELKPLKETSSLQKHQPGFFSSKRLNSCIILSERTRSFCALLIALFVLVSNIDHPLIGMNIVRSESIVASMPLYMISLTDLMVVLGRMFLYKTGDSEEAEEENAGSQNNRQGAVKLLERGLVVYQTIRALFIDYSIYVVVVICGLSLM